MKVCIVTYHQQAFDERAYGKLACSLQKHGHEVTRLCIGGSAASYTDNRGIHIIEIKLQTFSTKGWINYLVRRLLGKTRRQAILKAVLQQKADVFILFDFRTHYLATPLRQRFPLARIVYDAVDPTPQQIIDERPLPAGNHLWAWWQRRSEHRAMSSIDHILCTEPQLALSYRKRYPAIEQTILYNYTNLPLSAEQHNKLYDAIYCGLLSPNRGLWKMIDAAYLIKQTCKHFRLLLLGPLDSTVTLSQLLLAIQHKELQETVIVHPAVDHLGVVPFYQQSAIGLLPFQNVQANRQLLPVKLYEYLNFGLPIIAPQNTAMGNEVLGWKAGICVDMQDPQQLATAVVHLMTDKATYDQYSIAARNAAPHTRWEQQEAKLLSAINNNIVA